MRTLKKFQKKHSECGFITFDSFNIKDLNFENLSINYREAVDILSRLSNKNTLAVEHKNYIYLCDKKANYETALKLLELL